MLFRSERVFNTLVNWGRYTDLFDHDPIRGRLFIDPVDPVHPVAHAPGPVA